MTNSLEVLDLATLGTGTLRVLVSLVLIHIFFMWPVTAIHGFVERKLGADLQARVGPNRSGPGGSLQVVADALKLLQKRLRGSSVGQEVFWSACQLAALHALLVSLPLAASFLLVDTDMSILLPLWSFVVVSVSGLLMGTGRSEFPAWLSGIRGAFQGLSGIFPALISMLAVGVHAGGFRWTEVLAVQGFLPIHWNLLGNPFLFLSFFIFVASGMVILSIAPFDSSLGQVDLRGGVSALFSGRNRNLSDLIRTYGKVIWCVLAVSLFLGGWSLPVRALDPGSVFWTGAQLIVVGMKTFAVLISLSVIGRIMPRVRVDQVTDFSWRVLAPISLLCLLGTTLWRVGGGFL